MPFSSDILQIILEYAGGKTLMSTFMANSKTIQRQWFIIDASDKPLGRVATQAAIILRGKHKPEFTPHADCGDHVIIINAEKAVLTGNKLENKKYIYHTGYVGGLKEVSYRKLMSERPEKAMMMAVKGMLPKNSIGANSLTRLRVYKGAQHEQAAQKPVEWAAQ
jgi:large subunit ribosomal protein L13